MLSLEYKRALAALKAQGRTAVDILPAEQQDRQAVHRRLDKIHQEIEKYHVECKDIARILLSTDDPSLTITSLTEDRLERELNKLPGHSGSAE